MQQCQREILDLENCIEVEIRLVYQHNFTQDIFPKCYREILMCIVSTGGCRNDPEEALVLYISHFLECLLRLSTAFHSP